MAKGLQQLQGQNLPPDVAHVVDQLERHCLAPDGSLGSKSAYYDLQLAREEMCRERVRYLEAMAIYGEAIAMVEEYQQGLKHSSEAECQLYETLEHRMTIAEAAQRSRLPLVSKDGEVHEEEIEKCSIMSRSSLDSTCTGVTISSSSNSTNYTASNSLSFSATDIVEPGLGGVPNRFLGITPAYLWQTQLQQSPFCVDMKEYQLCLSREIEARLEEKCDKLADALVIDNIDSSPLHETSSSQLPERFGLLSLSRVKLITEEIEREEEALQEDLYSADRKFSEYYNVLEQILGVLVKLIKDLKLHHQHNYDELQKTWLCKRCVTMSAKLRKLEYAIVGQTYTKESVPALRKIRKHLTDATEEASVTYNKAVTRLHEYQGVDPHFDQIARQYRDIVKKLENMNWTIHQVEMDLKRLPDHPNA
ncbi:AUGMIN subunit 4 isoform X1 [Pyrus x bretschneideri]|uniref:AUGMIN subunit 4 isoform X1 n=1 Tax=Pyrus x bretschneideri TaxID=225117 RepID=UPI00202ECA17|nr:AUGMIN subunit 4 isoform X1 [Pyrus x bretschneideri]